MRIIAVANQKGGCGKTTTVINLAASLAHLSRKVLVIDMDPQGHVAVGLGVKTDQITKTIYDVLCTDDPQFSIDDIAVRINGSVSVVPSNIRLSALEQKLSGVEKREERLAQAIFAANCDYDYILIDTPPSVGVLTFNALRACREVIIPIDSSYFGLHGLGKLLETIILINERLNHNVRIKALSTLVDKRTKVSVDVLREIRKIFKENTFHSEISLNVKLKEAIGSGIPVLEYDANSVGTHDYLNLGQEIIDDEQNVEVQQLMTALKTFNDKTRDQEVFTPRFVDGGILFSIKMNKVKSVGIAGDFNNWKPRQADAFDKDENGVWSKVIRLNPGLYQYKMIIDGKWVSDPNNPIKVQSPFGGSNSVLVVKEEPKNGTA